MNRYVAGVAIATMLMGLGCGQKDKEKLRVFLVQGSVLKEAVAATAPSILTVTINPGPTVATQCTADVPWLELYTRAGTANNDYVRFQAKDGSQQTYRVTFPNTPLDTATIDNITNTPSALHQVKIDSATVCGQPSNNACAYPYNIFNITSGNPVPCNNGNSGPPYGVGSDGVVIKGGGG